jgi:hypothetical protein
MDSTSNNSRQSDRDSQDVLRLCSQLSLIEKMQRDGHHVVNGPEIRKDLERLLRRLQPEPPPGGRQADLLPQC